MAFPSQSAVDERTVFTVGSVSWSNLLDGKALSEFYARWLPKHAGKTLKRKSPPMPTINITGRSGGGDDKAWAAHDAARSSMQGPDRESDFQKAARQAGAQRAAARRGEDRKQSDLERGFSRIAAEDKANLQRRERILREEMALEARRAANIRASEQQAAARERAGRKAQRDLAADIRRSQQADQREKQTRFDQDFASAYEENRDRDRLDPYSYATNRVAGLGSTGNWESRRESLAAIARAERGARRRMVGADPLTVAKNQRILDAAQEARATTAGTAMLEGGAMDALGPLGLAAGAAFELAKKTVTAPFSTARVLNGIQSAAAPYQNMVMGAADLGRAGGFSGRYLTSILSPDKGGAPAWMKNRGLTVSDVSGIAGSYGISLRSGAEVKTLASEVSDANYTAYLGGLGNGRYARSLGLVDQLTGARPGTATNTTYLRNLQRIMQTATQYGLDHSQVMGSVEGLMKTAVSSGRGFVDASGETWLAARLMTSGDPSMRTGEGVASAAAGIQSAIGGLGLGGDTTKTQTLSMYLGKHGGLPKDKASLEKFLGVSRDSLSPASQKAFDNSLQAAQDGSTYWFASSVRPLISDSKWANITDEASGYFGLKGYQRTAVFGATSGGGDTFARAYQTGRGDMPAAVGKGWAGVDNQYKKWVIEAADDNKLNPVEFAAQMFTESRFNQNARNGSHYGIGQVSPEAFRAVQDAGLLRNKTFQDVIVDPHVNLQFAAAYRRISGSLGAYNQGPTGAKAHPWAAAAYTTQVMGNEAAFQDAGEINTIRAANVVTDQSNVVAGKQANNMSKVVADGGDNLLVFSKHVDDATGGLVKFSEQVVRAAAALSKMVMDGSAGGITRAAKGSVAGRFGDYTLNMPARPMMR